MASAETDYVSGLLPGLKRVDAHRGKFVGPAAAGKKGKDMTDLREEPAGRKPNRKNSLASGHVSNRLAKEIVGRTVAWQDAKHDCERVGANDKVLRMVMREGFHA